MTLKDGMVSTALCLRVLACWVSPYCDEIIYIVLMDLRVWEKQVRQGLRVGSASEGGTVAAQVFPTLP